MKSKGIFLIAAVVVFTLIYFSAYVVGVKPQQVVITQFGKVVGTPNRCRSVFQNSLYSGWNLFSKKSLRMGR